MSSRGRRESSGVGVKQGRTSKENRHVSSKRSKAASPSVFSPPPRANDESLLARKYNALKQLRQTEPERLLAESREQAQEAAEGARGVEQDDGDVCVGWGWASRVPREPLRSSPRARLIFTPFSLAFPVRLIHPRSPTLPVDMDTVTIGNVAPWSLLHAVSTSLH